MQYYTHSSHNQDIVQALWRLEKIILDTLDFKEVVQKICDGLLTELGYLDLGYKIIVLTLIDEEKQLLKRVALSQTSQASSAQRVSKIPFHEIDIPLSEKSNTLIACIDSTEPMSTTDWKSLFNPILSAEEARTNQTAAGITCSMVYPLIVRDKAIGAVIFSMTKPEAEVSDTERELLTGFCDIVGLAVQNSRLYTYVEQTSNELKAANARLKELDTLKDEFVSIASHELRTPLTSIRNYQWMLLNGKGGELAEKQRYYIERAYRATNRLTKLVTDMLNVSRIDSGRVLLAPEQCDLFDMTNEIIEELAVKSKERNISVEHQRPKHKLPPVVIDRDKIYEVITNLLSNAIKYTQIGGAITISYVHSKDMVTFVIEDNGMGIEPKYLDALFTKFGFVKNSVRSNHPNTESTGLGLYICKAIVELHGGTIWAKSAGKDQGSTFAFTIPVYTERLYAKMTREYNKEKDAGLLHNSVD